MTEYIAGTCNIGKAEVRQRRVVSLIGLAIAVTSGISLFAADAPRGARLGLFVPLMVWAIGYVQARRGFCMAYGLLGTFNFDGIGRVKRVQDPVARKADRVMAIRILVEAALYAGVITAAIWLLP
jgi:hypothetical protein